MSNSSLVNYVKLSPNCTKPRNRAIKKITIHHMAGNLSVETCGALFAKASRKASSNYAISSDGKVGMYVEEKNRAWTSGSAENDNQAITIEVANDEIGGDWHVSDTALAKLIDLCTDICKRNGIDVLIFTGDKRGNLTMHRYFQATACPGAYLASKFPYIVQEVNKRLTSTEEKEEVKTEKPKFPYLVKVTASVLNVRAGAGTKFKVNTTIKKGQVYTIVDESNGWGKLKSGAGWIYLKYTTKY